MAVEVVARVGVMTVDDGDDDGIQGVVPRDALLWGVDSERRGAGDAGRGEWREEYGKDWERDMEAAATEEGLLSKL